jgi:hypothetical protein
MRIEDRVDMLPRNWERALGYDAKARDVAFYWTPVGDEVMYDGDESAMTVRLSWNQDVDLGRKAHFFDGQRRLHTFVLHRLQQGTGHAFAPEDKLTRHNPSPPCQIAPQAPKSPEF